MYTNDYLSHHGILGQKWGIRRYQNEDGSLTVEGTKHYGYGNVEKADERDRINRVKKGAVIAGGIVAGLGAAVVVGNTLSKDEKDMNAMDKEIYGLLTKTDAGKNIVDELRRDKDSVFDLDTDYVIPKGTTVYNVGRNPNGPTHQGKWMSINKSDADFYKGMYTKIMDARSGPSDKYQTTYVADKDIKGAGRNTASKVFMDQYRKDKALRETFWDRVNYHAEAHPETLGNMREILAKADANRNKSIGSRIDYEKKMRDIGYDFFNIGLTDTGSKATSKATKTDYSFDYDMGKNFFNDLSKKGYGSIRDVHDLKYSTFHTKDPQIMFNTDRDLRKIETRKLSKDELDKTAKDTALVYASRLVKHHSNNGKGGKKR